MLRALLGVGVLVLLIAAAIGYLLYTGLRARNELQAVRDGVRALRADISAGDLSAAQQAADAVRRNAARAHDDTTGPLWAAATHVAGVGTTVRAIRGVTTGVDELAGQALPPLVDASITLAPAHLRRSDGSFDVAAIASVAPAVTRAAASIQSALDTLDAAPASTMSSTLDTARAQLISDLQPLRATVASLGRAIAVIPPLLGADGPRTYMITFENDAEVRATGGLPGAFAIVRADHGAITFTHFEPDNYLVGTPSTGLNLGPVWRALYGGLTGNAAEYRDSNSSPHFPYAAQIWAAMWHTKTGEHLDGAIGIDPTALSYLLQVAGPVTVNGSSVDGSNVVALTQQQIYARFPKPAQNDQRKNYLLEVAAAVSRQLLSPGADIAALVHAGARAADEHRLMLWTADDSIEAQLLDVALGGTLPDTGQPFVALGINNNSQSKLNYYTHASLDWSRTGCGSVRDVTVTVRLTNAAPPGLPPYVLGNSDPPGDDRLLVGVYATRGAHFTSVTVGGRHPFFVAGTDQGHPAYIADVVLARGATVDVVYHLREPAGTQPVTVRAQPLVVAMTTTVHDQRCG